MVESFFYDEFSDRLMISCKKPSDKINGSVRVLNVTLDFTTDGRIANVEIRNISDYIASLGISADILNNLEDAKLNFKQYRDGYMIYFILKAKQGNVERIPFNVPMNRVLATA
jgi:hypothetical protein